MPDESELVTLAQRGDRKALNDLVSAMKDMIYNLALRMLGSPADAEDSTQEILIRLVTGLRDFRAESSFRTWVYRVAANHLLTTRRRQAEERIDSFEAMAAALEPGMRAQLPSLEDELLVKEAKLRCTSGMLMALDRDHRLAFIFGEILEMSSTEGAAVLDVGEDAFRKRLSRARGRMAEFMNSTCGLVAADNPCRCGRQAACAAQAGHLDRSQVVWAAQPEQARSRQAQVVELDRIARAAEVFRGLPEYTSSAVLVDGLRRLLAVSESGIVD